MSISPVLRAPSQSIGPAGPVEPPAARLLDELHREVLARLRALDAGAWPADFTTLLVEILNVRQLQDELDELARPQLTIATVAALADVGDRVQVFLTTRISRPTPGWQLLVDVGTLRVLRRPGGLWAVAS